MTDVAGEHIAFHARATPDKAALVMHGSGATLTYRELDDASTKLARVLRERGLRTGDHLAVLLDNQPEFFIATWAGLRAGMYVTPINWHLAAGEAGYIVRDCGAAAIVASAKLASTVEGMADDLAGVGTRLAVDGAIAGFEDLDAVLGAATLGPVDDESEGMWMLYSSGTTGKPKGVKPPLPNTPIGSPSMITALQHGLFGLDADTIYLSPAPLYHAAPAGWTNGIQRLGGTAVVMERFDPHDLMAAIERHRITHLQVVPTHLVRLLKLPAEERARYDLSSLKMVVHAAAPCPVEIKRQALEWLGPIVHEYYSGSEGAGFCRIGPEEWLAHPGSVGRSIMGAIHIVGEDGEELPVGEAGEIWFETNRRFEYHGDPEKTAAAFDEHGWATLRDVGRLDEEGYLYLTDRSTNMIISGGVNIYPQETEDVLIVHPSVADCAVIGTPEPEMGEQVTAFVQTAPGVAGTDELAAELIAYCRANLSHYKCPREIRFVDELPRLPTGKLLKRLLK